MKKKNLIQFFLAHDYLLFAGHIALAVWQSKWNELRQVSHRTSVQSKEKWSCGEIAARTSDKWWWLSCAEIPAILASFCGDPVYIDFDITPARPPVVRSNKWKVIRLLSPCFFLSHKFDSLFSSFLIYFGALSYLSSLRLPPHQKIPFPSENGNFTIFAAYQSNLRGGEMEMWK